MYVYIYICSQLSQLSQMYGKVYMYSSEERWQCLKV
jgi:hypothetical protein